LISVLRNSSQYHQANFQIKVAEKGTHTRVRPATPPIAACRSVEDYERRTMLTIPSIFEPLCTSRYGAKCYRRT
jgi:hypothetical protein